MTGCGEDIVAPSPVEEGIGLRSADSAPHAETRSVVSGTNSTSYEYLIRNLLHFPQRLWSQASHRGFVGGAEVALGLSRLRISHP
jgi:hypothetical protein